MDNLLNKELKVNLDCFRKLAQVELLRNMDDERIDIHTDNSFKVRDYIVTRKGDGNFLVSPYYAEAGGTVLDWISPNSEDSCEKTKDNPVIGTISR